MTHWDMLLACHVIDLSVTISSDLPSGWPTHMPFASKVWNYYTTLDERQGTVPSAAPYQTRFWIIDEHCGTHLDAPTHFIPPPDSDLPWAGTFGTQSADLVPLRELMGPAAVIDVASLCAQGHAGESPWITVEHVQAWEHAHGALQAGEAVLFATGWDAHYVPGSPGNAYCRDPLLYKDAPGWPAPEVATILYLHEQGIRCVGIDAPSIGAVQNGIPAHQAGLSRGMRYVELLTNLHLLPSRGACFLFLPMKVAGSTGGPGRAIALVDNTLK